jgi:hypothetical protein
VSNKPLEKEGSWKNIVFITSSLVWQGGTLFALLLSFLSLDPWRAISKEEIPTLGKKLLLRQSM